MSNEIKILLTINLEGSLSQTREETVIHVTEQKEIGGQKIIKQYDKQHFQRIPSIAYKKVSLGEIAVNYMLSNEIPDWYKAKWNQHKQWFELTDDEKLKQHLTRIAHPNTFTFVHIDK